MPSTVGASGAFAAGIVAQAFSTYRKQYEINKTGLAMMGTMDFPSTRRQEIHFYWKTPAYPVRWPYGGAPMASKPFGGVQFKIENQSYARSVSWDYRDALDEQTNGLLTQARGVGENFAYLIEEIFFLIRNAGTDLDLLETVPNAPDGSAIFADATRFGITAGSGNGGNAINGGTMADAAEIRTDYYTGLARALNFQDTEGKPLMSPGALRGAKLLTFNPAQLQVVEEAFLQLISGNPTSTATHATSNVIQDTGRAPILWPNQNVTAAEFDIWFADSNVKPLVHQARDPLFEQIFTRSNSEVASKTGIESVDFSKRDGFGVNEPYGAIQVSAAGGA